MITRNLDSLSLLNPLYYGDVIELNGTIWHVGRGDSGWYLHAPGSHLQQHPQIHSIFSMADFIDAILHA